MSMSFSSSRILRSVAAFAAASCIATSASKAALLLDFGPTSVTNVSPSFDATVSPAHSAGAISASVATWNKIGTADISSGLLYGDGSAATGVAVDLGRGAGDLIINFANNPDNATSVTGSQFSDGVYSGTRVARDSTFYNSSNGTVGIQVTGLAAGQYIIYLTGRNTNASVTTSSQRFYGIAGLASSSFNFSTVTNFADISNSSSNTAGSNNNFVQGVQYNTLTVALATGQSLFIAADATGVEGRTFVNSIEIVLVPEPASLSLLALAGGAMLRRRRG